LAIFTLTGEKVYETNAQEPRGTSTLVWGIENNNHQALASGLYIFLLKASGGGFEETREGKVLIVH
jgi:hypothetical protein